MKLNIKASISIDVEYVVEADHHNDAKRKLLDRLAIDGYKNSKILYTTTSEVPEEPEFVDIDSYTGSYFPCYMYGKP